jgi:cytochrome c-type biogenesis protein CcmE
VARRGNPARLVIALSVAGVLAIFLVYTSVSGGTPSLQPSQLPGHYGRVSLVGKVAGPATGDGHDSALRFRLRDRSGTTTVPVVYRGSVPDLFKPGREVVVDGRLVDGTFVAVRDTLVTKCPSKYAPAKKTSNT